MANLKIIFDASIAAALAAIDKLVAKDAESKKKMAEPGPEKSDRRAALEEVKTAKIAAETAKREKLETEAAIRVQAATVKSQAAAVQATAAAVKASQGKGDAAKKETEELAKQTKELEKQRGELERLRAVGKIRGQAVDVATMTEQRTRQAVRVMPITPKVEPAPAVSAFARIFAAGKSTAARIETRYQAMKTRLSSVFSGLRGVFAGALAFTGFTLGIGALRSVITSLDDLGKSARNLNISAEELQKFQHAANSVNFPVQQIEPAFNKMRKLIGDAVEGVPDARKKLNLLGVSLDDLAGKTTAQQFQEIAAAINGIADPTERATAAARIFGEEQGPKMLNFLREYKTAAADLESRGGVITDEQVQTAEDFNQACTNIAASLKAWAVNAGFIKQLQFVAGLLNKFTLWKGEFGIREIAVKTAISEAEKSGNYTPEQIEKMKRGSFSYKEKAFEPIQAAGSFSLIDQAMKEVGLGEYTRTDPNNRNWTKQWAGTEEAQKAAKEKAERKKAEEEQKKQQERDQRRAAAKAEAETDFNGKIDQQVRGLENKASGKSDDREERRRAVVEAETAKAEQAAKSAGMKLTDEQRGRVEHAAGQVFDAEESQKEGKAHDGIDEEITALEEKYKIQQLINLGKAREAAIQEEINRAEKSARASGVELTDEERGKISAAAGKNFDQAVANEISPTQGPERKVFSDSMLRMGGIIGNVGGPSTVDYGKQQVDKLAGLDVKMADLQAKLEAMSNKMPGRLEAVTSSDPEF